MTDTYHADLKKSMELIRKACDLLRQGKKTAAWKVAQQDPLLLPSVTKEQWLEWMKKKLS